MEHKKHFQLLLESRISKTKQTSPTNCLMASPNLTNGPFKQSIGISQGAVGGTRNSTLPKPSSAHFPKIYGKRSFPFPRHGIGKLSFPVPFLRSLESFPFPFLYLSKICACFPLKLFNLSTYITSKKVFREILCKICYPSFEKHIFMHTCVFQQVAILDYGCKGPRTPFEKEVFNSF